ncbi:MAG TPA: hydantoinase/oxoprolinase family protein [Desulfomonilia bacterium]|nr:hydantoinase/oxoprolinase family protein [Desulfomonilia bacterium]
MIQLMILGIDIGGTHTDAVCLKGRKILSTSKTTTGRDLVDSILEAVDRLGIEYQGVTRVILSTTLSTNAIVEKKYAKTGMIVSAGPGIDPTRYFLSDAFHLVKGAIDHRGREYVPIDKEEVLNASRQMKNSGVECVGIVSKFSVRNSVHESSIASLIKDDFTYFCQGHTMSGSLNFPRRLNTTYFNVAVMPVQERFVSSVQEALSRLGINAPLFFLKADGGTYASSAANRLPVETILSGPAASMMGALALTDMTEGTALVLDIGGTTTDIGILLNGIPVFEPKGVDIGGLKTLVRGLKVYSVGAGGDSCVWIKDGDLQVGPGRSGPPACMGGPAPTPMDAFAALGKIDTGDSEKAIEVLKPLADDLGTDIPRLSTRIISIMVENIRKGALAFVDQVNSNPVYTIHEMLHPDIVRPQRAILIGGPAHLLKPYLEESLHMECEVPGHAMVANALGAALARTTAQITLLADTQLKRIICPELHMEKEAGQTLSMDELKVLGFDAIRANASLLGLSDDVEFSIIEEQSFNMVRGFSTVGRNMRVKIQTRPGILSEWSRQ